MTYEVIVGNCLDELVKLDSESIDCIITSPPYFNLRDYENTLQIGSENTVNEYISTLSSIFSECHRVLKSTGTFWLNLGDSYRNKELLMIPHKVALRLQQDGWILRNDIIWEKPNVMPSSAKDRLTVSHEHIFLLTKSKNYFFDRDAILEPYTKPMNRWGGEVLKADGKSEWDEGTGQKSYRHRNMRPNSKGRNRRTVWNVPTNQYKGAHFAVYPPKLIEPCVLGGCPKNGIILDPFAGSGTTAGVAEFYQRNSILIELNEEYAKLIPKRIESVIKKLRE